MKTFEQQKDIHALDMGYKDWYEFIYSTDCPDIVDKEYDEVAKKYATEVAKEALRNASESVTMKNGEMRLPNEGVYIGTHHRVINKQSILNENNIPKLD